MNLSIEIEAYSKTCPHVMEDGVVQNCFTSSCMGWIEVYPRIKMENHSGAYENLVSHAVKRKWCAQAPRKEGPDNSSGFVVLDAVGYCGKNNYQAGQK